MDRPLRVFHLFTDAFVLPWAVDLADPVSMLTWPASSFARYGDRERFQVVIGSLRPPGKDAGQIPGLRVELFPWNGRLVDPVLMARLVRWLVREKIDVVHTHLFHGGIFGMGAARLARTPVITTTTHHSHEPPISGSRAAYWMDSVCLGRLAHQVIAPCRVMRDILVYGYRLPPEKVSVIHHGLDDGRFVSSPQGRERVRTELGLQGKVVLGALGRLHWLKQYPLLIQSFAAVARTRPELVLVIAGFGTDRDALLERAAGLGLQGRVLLPGGRADVPDLLAAMDLFVHPARTESFGLVLVEALAAGKPLVSNDVGIAPDLLADGQAGLLVPVGDPQAFTQALEQMLQIRDRWPAMGEEGRRRARAFSARTMVAEYEAHYRKWFAQSQGAA